MGQWAAFVVTRGNDPVAALPGVDAFGHRHTRLVDLGDGRQQLITRGPDDPPELALVTAAAAERWNEPVLSGYVMDSDCVEVHWALPGGPPHSTHLPDPARVGCGYRHRSALPEGRSVEEVVADLDDWAKASVRAGPVRAAAGRGDLPARGPGLPGPHRRDGRMAPARGMGAGRDRADRNGCSQP